MGAYCNYTMDEPEGENGAAYRIRTGDFQFGKLTFYR